MTEHEEFDVLVIGSGLMGAAVARCLRDADPDLTIGMVDGGPQLGSIPGQHLHDVPEPEIWSQYNQKVATGIQGFYTSIAPTIDVSQTMVDVAPGMYHLTSLGEDASSMPGAAVAWNVGGMGVHWTAATPTPWGSEVNSDIPADQWARDLSRASELLRVNQEPFPRTPAGEAVLHVLNQAFGSASADGRAPQNMPMAVNRTPNGSNERTGPNLIFPPIADESLDSNFTLLVGTLALRLIHEAGLVHGARVRDVISRTEHDVRARTVVVCADAIRTPQLLFASGIRPPALGRFLNEHAFLTGRVLADPEVLGFDYDRLDPPTDLEGFVDWIWVPHSGPDQPFQVYVTSSVMVDDDYVPLAYAVGLEVYVPTDIRPQNALHFSETDVDSAGLPRITVDFSYSEDDQVRIAEARRLQRDTAARMGPFDPDTESELLPPGSSLHFTGTVRMGPSNDGTSVCDTDCKVWDFDNLYVAGCGVIPTALACNATLTGMTTAVRAAAAAGRTVGPALSTEPTNTFARATH